MTHTSAMQKAREVARRAIWHVIGTFGASRLGPGTTEDLVASVAAALISETAAKDALLKEAVEVLRPFAKEADETAKAISDDTAFAMDGFPDLGLTDFTVGDLRCARAFLDKIGDK